MAKFKNLVDHLRQKRLEGVVSVDDAEIATPAKTDDVVKVDNEKASTTDNTTTPKTTRTRRKGK